MNLPEDDESFLVRKGYEWTLSDASDGGLLVVKSYRVNGARYDRSETDLLLRIPAQYNMARLDMWWVEPHLRLRSGGNYPEAASTLENYLGKVWQRFSRHLPDGVWRAGVDGLPMFLTFINRELQG